MNEITTDLSEALFTPPQREAGIWSTAYLDNLVLLGWTVNIFSNVHCHVGNYPWEANDAGVEYTRGTGAGALMDLHKS